MKIITEVIPLMAKVLPVSMRMWKPEKVPNLGRRAMKRPFQLGRRAVFMDRILSLLQKMVPIFRRMVIVRKIMTTTISPERLKAMF